MFFGGVLCCAWLFKSDYLFWDGHCMVFHWGAVNFLWTPKTTIPKWPDLGVRSLAHEGLCLAIYS